MFYSGKLFGKIGTDSTLQLMYFVPFLQKTFLSYQPFWSWSYGLGGDIFGQFSYYYTTSPFFYIMLLLRKIGIGSWTLENTLQWKMLFSILKQTVAMGIFYSLLKYERRKTYTSLIGAMIYGGCIHFIWFSLFFDFMTDAYIWLPLTILGWRIYQKTGKWLFFVISAALTVGNSFYFGFISFIFYSIFMLVFLDIQGTTYRQKIASLIKSISNYILYIILALGLAAVAFIPSVSAFLNTNRFSTLIKIPVFYDPGYILGLPEKMFFYTSTLGFPLIILIVFALPWKQLASTTKRKTVLAGLLLLLYLIPFSGSFFNGLSYVSDRWFYLFIFSVAYAVPDWLEENDKLKSAGIYFFSILAILSLFFFYTIKLRGLNVTILNESVTNLINLVILISGLITLFAVSLKKYTSKRSASHILRYTIIFCSAIALMGNVNTYLYMVKPYVTNDNLQNSGLDNKEEVEIFQPLIPSSSEFYRTIFRNLSEDNAPMNYGYYGTSAYNSMIDGNLHRWLKDDFNIRNPYVSPSRYGNFDDRLFLETFFGVKYLVKNKNDPYVPSFGYEVTKQTDHYFVYKNQVDVGFDLWYTNTTTKNSFDKMTIAEKDAMILQTAVIDKEISGLSSSLPDQVTSEITLDWANARSKNIEYKDGVLIAGKNALFNIPIDNKHKASDGEILLTMDCKPMNGQKIVLNVNGKSTLKMEESYPYVYPLNQFTFRLEGDSRALNIVISEGKYIFSNVHCWFNSYQYYPNWVNERNKYNLKDLYIKGGTIKGTIKNYEKGILALNIPFSKGWSAKVDGKRKELIKVNGVVTGIVLDPGDHKIELSYITPGVILGSCVSFVFLIGIIYLLIRRRIRKF